MIPRRRVYSALKIEETTVSLRNDWEFNYTAGQAVEGAKKKKKKHEERRKYWEEQKEEALDKLRSAGLKITPYEEGKLSAMTHHEVQFDPELTDRLSECEREIRKNKESVEQYSMWATVLGDQKEDLPLKLHAADASFFGLGDNPPEFTEGSEF